MTHSGGKPHQVGYKGQQYEVSIYDDDAKARRVFGWSNDPAKASEMALAAELRPSWNFAWVTNLHTDISHTKTGPWVGERPLPPNKN